VIPGFTQAQWKEWYQQRIRELEAERDEEWKRRKKTEERAVNAEALVAALDSAARKAEASRDISIRIASERTIERDALKARVAELERRERQCGRHVTFGEPLAAIERGEREEG